MKTRAIYRKLCVAADLERASAELSDSQIRRLYGRLARAGVVSGIPSLIQGVLAAEMVRRFSEGGKR